jgi:GTP-binding protein
MTLAPDAPTRPVSPAGDTLRNIAIIAHVDHGKTTLVDAMFRQSGIFRSNEAQVERAMDSHDLERERGITILAKNTAIVVDGVKINILDTPGHADFSGEVERVLNMVDGVLLIVDAVEGPMPQTRFVLREALKRHLRPLVVINKMDRPAADPERAVDRVLDLFIDLGAEEDLLDFPVVYAIGATGQSKRALDAPFEDLRPLFDAILTEIPAPPGSSTAPLRLQVATLDYNDYLGRILIGRVHDGQISVGQSVMRHVENGAPTRHRISKLFGFEGLKRLEVAQALAGDIVAIAGLPEADIGDTLVDAPEASASGELPPPLPRIVVEAPTLQMIFSVSSSPFAGREGQYVTSRHLRDRLHREARTNISLRIEDTDSPDRFRVSGRGELHLSILIETMRREGYEFQVGQPEVITREENGVQMEPVEQLILDVPEENAGACIERLGPRRGELHQMASQGGRSLLEFLIPARGLLGFRSEFIRLTKGNGILSHAFFEYRPLSADLQKLRNGALIAVEEGDATAYALKNLEDRGAFFIAPKTAVYRGMIVGEHNRQNDLGINVCKTKKLTNMRSASAEVLEVLATPVALTLEFGLDFLGPGEWMEVTPESLRLRKDDLSLKGVG